MMKKPMGVMLAAAAAAMALAPSVQVPSSQQSVSSPRVLGGGGMQVPQGGIGTMLSAIMGTGGGSVYTRRPTYGNGNGYSVAEGARRKRRMRNKLRAKGQFRRAVR